MDFEDDPANLGNDVEEIVDSNGDLMNDVQVGRKFNSFEEVKELLRKLRAYNHPMLGSANRKIDIFKSTYKL